MPRIDRTRHATVATLTAAALLGAFAAAPAHAEVSVEMPDTIKVSLYGTIKLDAAYDTSSIDVGNFARWVESPAVEDDDQFNLTARQTRLGLRLAGPETEALAASGRVEIDFYEGGEENKNRLMLRHAYMVVDWLEPDIELLAGQTSDLISPLVPMTLNYSVAWWAGNIGYRRPQARLT